MPQLCRKVAAMLSQFCCSVAAVLPQFCRNCAAVWPQFCFNRLVTRSFAACSFAAVLPQLFGHTQFCRTQFCRMQCCRNCVAIVMQFCCSVAAILRQCCRSLPQSFGRSFAAALPQQCCRSNVAAVLPQSFGHTQFCRNVAAMLPQFCRNSAAILTQLCCNFVAMLPQFCRNAAQFSRSFVAHFGGFLGRSEVLFREGPNVCMYTCLALRVQAFVHNHGDNLAHAYGMLRCLLSVVRMGCDPRLLFLRFGLGCMQICVMPSTCICNSFFNSVKKVAHRCQLDDPRGQHHSDLLSRSALGLVWVYNHLPPKIVEQPSVKDQATARYADWAQSLSPRAPLSSHALLRYR